MRRGRRISGVPSISLAAALTFSLAAQARAGVNPESLFIKVLEARLSPNTDCSQAVTVFKPASPAAVDFVSQAPLGTGVIPNGTYHCVALHISDVVQGAPAANDGTHCVAGTSFTQDIFNTPSQGDVSIAPDGTVINGRGSFLPGGEIEDDPWVYFSDSPDAASANGCYQPTKSGNSGPCVLSNAIRVNGDQTREFVFDFDGVISDQGSNCSFGPPVVSFR